uniref:Uncharacterized protein n=1 Tax=Setaria italica TaxID=4555 RepID=K3ZYB7_SETIT
MFCNYTKEIAHLSWCGLSHVKLNSSMPGHILFSINLSCQRGSCSCRTTQLEREPWPRETPIQTWDHPPCKFQPSNGTWHTNKCQRVENRGSCTEGRQDKPKNPN